MDRRTKQQQQQQQQQAVEQEIHRLHDFFVKWFKAEVDHTDEAFQAVSESMGHDFHLIPPQGTVVLERTILLQALNDAYGSRKGPEPFQIQCRHVKILQELGETLLVCYEEWQTIGTVETARLSSAWFQKINTTEDSSSPLQLKWLHVHETWLPDKGPPSADKMWTPPPQTEEERNE